MIQSVYVRILLYS